MMLPGSLDLESAWSLWVAAPLSFPWPARHHRLRAEVCASRAQEEGPRPLEVMLRVRLPTQLFAQREWAVGRGQVMPDQTGLGIGGSVLETRTPGSL